MPAFLVSPRSGHPRRGVTSGLVAASLAGLMALQVQSAAPVHAAEPVPVTYQGQSYPLAGPAPTEDKPQSKLWFNDGAWWALMRVAAGVTVHRLGADHVWTDTGTVVDERLASTADVLWEGGKLYVGSRTGSGALRVIRLSYDDAADAYGVDFSQQVAGGGSESITLARDSRARLWVTYEQGERIHVVHSTTDDRTWGAPYPIPVTTAGADNDVAADDISAIVAFSGKIGVMWSDQDDDVMRFAVHADTADDQTWTMETALSGPNLADDHLNLKSLLEDDHGRIYAAVKTSRGDAGEPTTDPSIMVLQRTADGTWSSAQASSVGDKLTRPQLALDSTNRRLYVLMATESGGSVYYKTAPLGSLSFPVGKGDTFITYPGASINDASTAKHAVNATTGLVVLASDDDAQRYYHGELTLDSPPPADTTAPGVPQGLTATAASPTSVALGWQAATDDVGVTGYMVSRDGAAATTVATTSFTDTGLTPGTTYSYTVSAIDAAGNRSAESAPVTATTPAAEEPPPSGSAVSFVAAASVNGASNTISAPTPAGVQAGDVLLATVSVRGAPTITPSPGWTLVRVDSNATSMRQAIYRKVAVGGDPASTWTLNKAQATVVQTLAYRGVDTTNPVVASAGATTTTASLVSPAVATVSGSPVLTVAGIARQTTLTPPSTLTERSENASTTSSYKISADAADTVATGTTAGPFTTTAGGSAAGIAQTVSLRPRA